MSQPSQYSIVIEHDDATDYQVATAALAGWRVRLLDDDTLRYRFELRSPDGWMLNRYHREREAWAAAFQVLKEEDNYRGGN